MTAKQNILALRPCDEAREWLEPYGDDLARAWAECPRGDWMLWLAARAGVDRKAVVLSACAVARTALRFVPAGEDRPRIAIGTTEAWCRGEATIERVRAAANAAYAASHANAAADAAAADAAADAAAHAAHAAYAAEHAADAADAAAAAADAAYAAEHAADAADAAANAAANAARTEAHAEHASIVRSMISWEQVEQELCAPKEGA